MFAAGIGRFDRAKARGRIGTIDGVEKDQTWLAAGPRGFDEPIEYELCREPPRWFVGMGIDQGVGATACEGPHERIGDADREIEIRHFGRGLFECDEVENVRVVDTEDAHICAAPGSTLFDDVC